MTHDELKKKALSRKGVEDACQSMEPESQLLRDTLLIRQRAERANKKDFENILNKVPKRKPLPGDEI